MVNQSFMLDLLTRSQAAQGEIKKAEPQKDTKMQFPQFRDILSSTMDRPSVAQARNKVEVRSHENRSLEKDTRQDAQFKTFKEAARNAERTDSHQKLNKSSSAAKSDRISAEEMEDEVKKVSKTKEDAVLENLAQVLGLNKNDLMNLLGALNIKPEELSDPSKTGEIVDKLAGIMGLDNNQKNTLANIISSVNEQIGEHFEGFAEVIQESEQKEPLSDGKEVKNKGPEVEVVKDPKAEFQEMMVKFKARLEEIRNSLNRDPQALAKEIVKNLEEMMQKGEAGDLSAVSEMEANGSAKPVTVAEKGIPDSQNEEIQAPEAQKADNASKSDNGMDSSGKESKDNAPLSKTVQSENVLAGGNNDGEAVNFNNVISAQAGKTAQTAEASKLHKEMPITRNELVNQVVEKAKVVISGEKSEMVMELKPESLGKLSLKVVTERGMVVAHFVAESQQVKQVLESNMQLLKDTLEKQGMAVQGFSVSVGQDSQKEFNKGEWSKNRTGSNNAKINSNDGIGVGASGVFEGQKSINAYNWSDSSINLTA